MTTVQITDEPGFDHDDLNFLKEEESIQLFFRESRVKSSLGRGFLAEEVKASDDAFDTSWSPFDHDEPLPVRPALSDVQRADEGTGTISESCTPLLGNDEILVWEPVPYDGNSWDDLAVILAPELFSDALTREQRALQIAAQVADDYGWDRAGIALLAEVFGRYSWSACQVAVRRAIDQGMTQKEFAIAARVREMWSLRCEFWVALSYGSLIQRYALLTWPGALSLIRSFEGYPDVDEVESLLDMCLEQWLRSSHLQLQFQSFLSWALYRCENRCERRGFDAWSDFGDCMEEDDQLDDVSLIRDLDGYGLRPALEWHPVSQGAGNKETLRQPTGLDLSAWQMIPADGDDGC